MQPQRAINFVRIFGGQIKRGLPLVILAADFYYVAQTRRKSAGYRIAAVGVKSRVVYMRVGIN
jgi:hypothetical protein